MIEISDMQVGKAGEYLVCSDLIIQGYIAFPSEQGLPYDVVVQGPKRLIKIQVKSMRAPVMRNGEPPLYSMSAMQRGKHGKSKYRAEDADVFEIVALDEKSIAYLHATTCKTCMQFRVEAYRGQYLSDRVNAAVQRAASLRDAGNSGVVIADVMGVSKVTVHRYI